MARRRHRLFAVLIAAMLAVTGCGLSPLPSSQAAAYVDTVRQLPISGDAVAAVTEVLAASGVVVVENDAEPGTGQLTEWQVRNLTTDAANGGGITGVTLEELAPAPSGAPPMAFLLAAWISTFDSPGAEFSRELLGEQDWRRALEVSFPLVVLTLFLADATAGADMSATGPSAAMAVAAAGPGTAVGVANPVAAGPCTTATSFIQNAIASVANALKVNTSGGGVFGFLGKIWNTAVDLAAGLVTALIDTITRPVVNLLVDVFGVVAVIAQVGSFLTHWRVSATPEPEENSFGVIPNIVTGAVQIAVTDQQLPIPALIVDCAAAFDVDLNRIGSVGSRVTWAERPMGRPDLAFPLTADDVIDDNRAASYTYQTGVETPELAQSPEQRAGLLEVSATVERRDVERIRELFTHLLLDQIPARIRGLVEPIVRPILDASTRHLAAITDVRSVAYVAITYHVEPDPSPSPPDESDEGQPGGGAPGSGQPGGGQPGGEQFTAPDVTIPTACPPAEAIGYREEPTVSIWDSGAMQCQYTIWFSVIISHAEPLAYTPGVTLTCGGPELCWLDVVTHEGRVAIGDESEDRVLGIAATIFGKTLTVDRRN